MTVTLLKFIIEIPESYSLKDKRRVVQSLKHKMIRHFNVSAAEIDLHDSLRFAQIGAAYVGNSPKVGDSVMQKILNYVDDNVEGRLHDSAIHTEEY